MSLLSLDTSVASRTDVAASSLGTTSRDEVVEISLLLPATWTNALFALARRREQTVGQILRSMIGRALFDGDLTH